MREEEYDENNKLKTIKEYKYDVYGYEIGWIVISADTGAILQSEERENDSLGRVVHSITKTEYLTTEKTYVYDGLSAVISIKRTTAKGEITTSEGYVEYDHRGNGIRDKEGNGENIYVYNNENKMIEHINYYYGDTTDETHTYYTYGKEGYCIRYESYRNGEKKPSVVTTYENTISGNTFIRKVSSNRNSTPYIDEYVLDEEGDTVKYASYSTDHKVFLKCMLFIYDYIPAATTPKE